MRVRVTLPLIEGEVCARAVAGFTLNLAYSDHSRQCQLVWCGEQTYYEIPNLSHASLLQTAAPL